MRLRAWSVRVKRPTSRLSSCLCKSSFSFCLLCTWTNNAVSLRFWACSWRFWPCGLTVMTMTARARSKMVTGLPLLPLLMLPLPLLRRYDCEKRVNWNRLWLLDCPVCLTGILVYALYSGWPNGGVMEDYDWWVRFRWLFLFNTLLP